MIWAVDADTEAACLLFFECRCGCGAQLICRRPLDHAGPHGCPDECDDAHSQDPASEKDPDAT